MRSYRVISVCLILLAFAIVPSAWGVTPPKAQKGVLDLSGWDFSRDGPVSLAGEWQFFWSAHIPPGGPAPEQDRFITVPGSWNGIQINGEKISGQGMASFRLTVILPDKMPDMGIKFLDAATAFRAYADGKPIFSAGIPGITRETTTPGYNPGIQALKRHSKNLILLLHVSNFHHWQGGMWETVTIGPLEDLTRIREEKLFFDALLFGSILIMGIYHLLLFRFRPQERSTLYFGLFCLITALRPLFHGERSLMVLFPDTFSFTVFLRINYISFCLCVPLFSYFTLTLFPKQVSATVVRLISWTGIIAAGVTLFLPPTRFTALMPWLQCATLAAVGYGSACLVRATIAREEDAGLFMAGFLIFFGTIINDILYTRQFISTTHLVPLGFFVFILCQAALLSRRFSRAFDLVTRQQQALEAEITQRKKAERNLIESEKRFRLMTDFMPIPFCETDVDLNIVYANRAALGWFGYTEEEIANGLSLSALMAEPRIDTFAGLARHLKASREFLVQKKDTVRVWAHLETSPILSKGELMGHRFCFVDLHERKKAEDASIQAARESKYILVGQVAGKMAHDFNNILSAVMGNAEISLLDCRDKEIQESLEIILEQTKRGQVLTQNLVAFAKDQDPIEDCVGVNQKLDLTLNLLQKDLEGIRIEKEYDPGNPVIMADPGMIEQSLVNIIQNAVHAMSRTKTPFLRLRTRVTADKVIIDIADNGCGIPEEFHDQIYTPSFTLKGSRDMARVYAENIKGTGYGMANVKKYMEKHKGDISFVSVPGQGTCFTLALPVADKDCSKERPVPPLHITGVSGKKILVVEDETAISKVFKNILTHPPFDNEVHVAANGSEAMKLLERIDFHLVSLDHMLPGDVNGMGIYRHIRETRPDLPVIFVSGNMEFIASIQGLIRNDPFLGHLSKPCDNQAYARAIERWLV